MVSGRLRLCLFVLFLFPFAGCGGDELLGSVELPIVNGQIHSGHPAVGMIYLSAGLCTGSLVGVKTVLTASHCVTLDQKPPYKVDSSIAFYINGGIDANGWPTGEKYTGVSADIHPGYQYQSSADGGLPADVALIHLDRPVVGVKPIRIATTPTHVGEAITLVGYGVTADENNDSGTKRIAYNTVDALKNDHFTFTGATGNKGTTCGGDSGSSVLANRGGEEVVVGVLSTGTCSNQYDPSTLVGVAKRVDVFLNWLQNVGKGDLLTSSPVDTTPPKVTITWPGQGATVPASFEVKANVADDGALEWVRLFVDNQQVAQLQQPPFNFKLNNQPIRPLQLRVEARDKAGNAGKANTTVHVAPGQPFAAPCSQGSQCASGVCVAGSCSQSCAAPTDCPAGYQCNGACVRSPNGNMLPGGGIDAAEPVHIVGTCNLTRSPGAPPRTTSHVPTMLVLLGLLLVLRRR